MKKSIFALVLIFAFLQLNVSAQTSVDSTGMLGDNFSLEGALEIFKKSESPEDFEKKLNEEDNYVNNLDLNQDGKIDYIKVIDNVDGDAHAIVLQTDINEKESQDIAVIEMEKTGNNKVVLQIVGNEDLYGEDTYVEPAADETNTTNVIVVENPTPTSSTVVVNAWAWPSVQYVYGPRYHVWVSPWRWGYYPRYWSPWRPYPWRYYHSRRVHYNVYYRPVRVHRVSRAHRVYTPHRRTSVVVHSRSTSIRVKNKRNGKVVKTKTKTTAVGVKKKNNGKIVAGKRTTTTTKVKGKNKTTRKKTTTTTKVRKGKNKTTVTRTKKTKKTKRTRRRKR
ncbi:MAG TPA: hypothetical protein ENI82_06545 [Bacteroidetes bacterium]|nr:hypothetical protein [Bacteroidota bacterium]